MARQPSESDVARVRGVLHGVLDSAEDLVAVYFTSTERFAGATFDTLPPNPVDGFSASDVLAASLLDVPFLPRAVRSLLLGDETDWSEALGAVPHDVDLWDATDEHLQEAETLWSMLTSLDGVGPTRTSKLMARKRPRLIPVIDKVIREHLELEDLDSWQTFRWVMQDGALRQAIESVRPEGLGAEVTTVRLLDAAMWMTWSNSKWVRQVRARFDRDP